MAKIKSTENTSFKAAARCMQKKNYNTKNQRQQQQHNTHSAKNTGTYQFSHRHCCYTFNHTTPN
jgi:hypothetical protein